MPQFLKNFIDYATASFFNMFVTVFSALSIFLILTAVAPALAGVIALFAVMAGFSAFIAFVIGVFLS